jgi:Uma2 family endonuclease
MSVEPKPSTRSREVTYERYGRLPEMKRRHEIVDGIIEMSPAPTFWHQVTQGKFFRALDDFVTQHDLGLVILAPADVVIRKVPKLQTRQPDVLYFSDARAGFRCREDPDRLQASEIAPDLVLEIRSPSEKPGRWAETLADYASIRVREVWRADRKPRTIEVLVLRGDLFESEGRFGPGESVRSVLLPGLNLPVAAVLG